MNVKRSMTVAIVVALIGLGGWWFSNRAEPDLLRLPAARASAASDAFSYAPYAAALATHVDSSGMVNYRGLKTNSGDLDTFAASLGRVRPDEFESWSDEQKIAFWVNAYNALTLEAIIRNYPIKSSLLRSVVYPKNSIRQISGVWDKLRFVVAGRDITLDEIEHATLRTQFNEPRIHVALVCAAMSCPPLRREPYTGEQLDQQLDEQARIFLGSPQGLRIDRDAGRVHLSSIFKWFSEDFVKTYGTSQKFAGKSEAERAVLHFVSRYVSEADRDFLLSSSYRIEYLDYDWSLNEQPASRAARANR